MTLQRSRLTEAQIEALRAEHAASAVTTFRPPIPLPRFLIRIQRLHKWYDEHWRPVGEGEELVPGMDAGREPRELGAELSWLVTQLDEANLAVTLSRSWPDPQLRPEAEALLKELDHCLSVLRRVDPDLSDALDAARQARKTLGRSAAALAAALDRYGALCSTYAAPLRTLSGFQPGAVARCAPLAEALRNAPRYPRKRVGEAKRTAIARARWIAMADARRKRMLEAARFVYRAHPHVWRELLFPELVRARRRVYEKQREKLAAKRVAEGKPPPKVRKRGRKKERARWWG